MKRLLTLVAIFATLHASAQQVNPVPDYVFRNQMSVGRGTVTDTAAYFSIGPRYGATRGMMPPMVVDTAYFSANKRNGLLIFSVQKNKFLYWDSVRVQWSDMAGSSGSYITGSGITGYLPQFSASTTLDTSALFTIGNRLGVGSSTFAYNSTNTANVELNGTAGGILGFKRNDSARGYLWHTGDNMELANTAAGSIFFNTNSATRGSISSAGVWRLHNLAGTGDRVVVASSNGTLSAASSATALVDTTTISTRAWRQKGLDSLAALEVSGSGTTNYIPKFTAGSTIGNSIIQDNGTDVGIGSNSAGARLEILRTATGAANNNTTGSVFGSLHGSGGGPSAYGFAIRHNASAYAGISGSNFVAQLVSSSTNSNALEMYTTGATPLVLGTSATERLRITSGGDVGIGTTAPNGKLDVANAGDVAIWATATSAGSAALYLYPSGGGVAQIASVGAVPLQFLTNGSERLRITSDGDILHRGTYNPLSAANRGNIMLNGSASNIIGFSNNSALRGYIFHTDSDFQFYNNTTGGRVGLYTEGTARLWIQANGRIGINTTTDAGYQLDVNGDVRFQGTLYTRSGTNTGIVMASTSAIRNTGTQYFDYGTGGSGDFYFRGGSGFANVLTLMNGGNVGIGTASPLAVTNYTGLTLSGTNGSFTSLYTGASQIARIEVNTTSDFTIKSIANVPLLFGTNNTENARFNTGGELLINTTTDAGDYKLQVSGNALVTAGKLDITTNTGFGLSVTRSGTSVVAGQINNSNGILYYGAESSTGGGLFTGSSAYAAVIGSGAAYPLQFATDNVTRATINTNGELLINTLTDNGDFKLQVNGSALISGSIQTANPVSGTAVPWRLGSVVATNVQLDTGNYVEVNINGTFYRLAIVTPL